MYGKEDSDEPLQQASNSMEKVLLLSLLYKQSSSSLEASEKEALETDPEDPRPGPGLDLDYLTNIQEWMFSTLGGINAVKSEISQPPLFHIEHEPWGCRLTCVLYQQHNALRLETDPDN